MRNSIRSCSLLAVCASLASAQTSTDFDQEGLVEKFKPADDTRRDITPFLLSIPAPRGRILDRSGKVLADTQVAYQLTLSVAAEEAPTGADFVATVRKHQALMPERFVGRILDWQDSQLLEHFEKRRRMPLPMSEPMIEENGGEAGLGNPRLEGKTRFGTRPVYLRTYPYGSLAAHLIGHLGLSDDVPAGPVRQGEDYWRKRIGRAGLEKSGEHLLRGASGEMLLGVSPDAAIDRQDLIESPTPGADLVTSLDLPLQQAVEAALRETGRAGAVVVLHALDGDVLACASAPTYDPSQFVPAISSEDYQALVSDPEAPLFHRAVSAAYPPGSTFKPFVGLAVLESRALYPFETLQCGPSMEIDGRIFRNWSDDDRGRFNLRGALARSCNTWFYQAAIRSRDRPILTVANQFGFGRPVDLPLESVASGSLPSRVPSNQGLANLSIGQGTLSASPIQVARAMAGLCAGDRVPEPRLLLQGQTSRGAVIQSAPIRRKTISYEESHNLRYVRNGLSAVVNHVRGTGGNARVNGVSVSGKTGTSQWSRNGEESTAVWFAGYVPDSKPPLAFAVLLEGEPGEEIYGGSHAAPVVASFLEATFAPESDSTVRPAATKWTTPLMRDPLHARPARRGDVTPSSPPRAIPVSPRALQPLSTSS